MMANPASARDKISSISCFGSRARGDETPASDQDVLVFAAVADDPVALFQEVCRLLSPENPALRLDMHVYSPRLTPTLAFEILRDAKVLYEASPGQGVLDLAELALIAEPPVSPLRHFREVKNMGREETLRMIERRLVSLERRIAGLKTRLSAVSEEEFLGDEVLQEFAFARLYKTTQDVIDLSALLIALEGRTPPPEGSERLKVLGEMGLISDELSSRLESMARFRNVLAHIYEELDLMRLYRFAAVEIKDLEAFSEAVRAYLAGQV